MQPAIDLQDDKYTLTLKDGGVPLMSVDVFEFAGRMQAANLGENATPAQESAAAIDALKKTARPLGGAQIPEMDDARWFAIAARVFRVLDSAKNA